MSDKTRQGAWKDLDHAGGEVKAILPAVAQGATGFSLIGVAPFAGKITGVKYYPNSTITGADTNTRRLRVYNRKADASGTVAPADLQFNNTVNAPAKIGKAITLSVTAADLVVAAGDVLEANSSFVGTGIADPGGLIVVTIERSK